MDAETVADLVAPGVDTHPDAPALESVGDPDRSYDYDRLRTDARKTGNALSHQGVRAGRTLGIADDPVPETVLAFLGGALLGAVAWFDPPRESDARAVVAPTPEVGEYDLPAGGQRIGYGESPDDPGTVHFEEWMWSENPTFPPSSVDPGDAALVTPDRRITHAELLDAGREVAGELESDDTVAVRAPLSHPGTVAAGVVAPLLAGATVLLPNSPGGSRVGGTVAVAGPDMAVPESDRIDPGEY